MFVKDLQCVYKGFAKGLKRFLKGPQIPQKHFFIRHVFLWRVTYMYVQFGFVVNLLLVRGIEIVESGVKKKLTSITHIFSLCAVYPLFHTL